MVQRQDLQKTRNAGFKRRDSRQVTSEALTPNSQIHKFKFADPKFRKPPPEGLNLGGEYGYRIHLAKAVVFHFPLNQDRFRGDYYGNASTTYCCAGRRFSNC